MGHGGGSEVIGWWTVCHREWDGTYQGASKRWTRFTSKGEVRMSPEFETQGFSYPWLNRAASVLFKRWFIWPLLPSSSWAMEMTDSIDQHLCRRSGPLWNAQLHTVWSASIGATPPPPATPQSEAAIHFTTLGCCHRGGESLSQNSWWLVHFSLSSTVWEYFQNLIYPLLKKKKNPVDPTCKLS